MTALSEQIGKVAVLCRRALATGQPITLDATAGLFAMLQGMAHQARLIEADLAEMEAVARDLDALPRCAPALPVPPEQVVLRAAQREIADALEAEAHGGGRVIAFPVVPRPVPVLRRNACKNDCQDDGEDGA